MENQTIQLWQVMIVSSLRYIVFAGLAYLIFYVWKKKSFIRFKIQQHFPGSRAVRTELLYSLSTIVIFGLIIYGILFTALREHSMIYTNFSEYTLAYLPLSFILVLFFHDTYFYWMHRFMHWKKVFPFVHHIHHRSHNPTPLAAFSFHPVEALLEIAVLPLIAFTFPVHKLILGLFGLYMIVMNVIGHLGFEFLPLKFMKTGLFRLLSTSTHHNMHHHYGRGNYGLYFNIWDRLMKTNHVGYEKEFENITSRAEQAKKSEIQQNASGRMDFAWNPAKK